MTNVRLVVSIVVKTPWALYKSPWIQMLARTYKPHDLKQEARPLLASVLLSGE